MHLNYTPIKPLGHGLPTAISFPKTASPACQPSTNGQPVLALLCTRIKYDQIGFFGTISLFPPVPRPPTEHPEFGMDTGCISRPLHLQMPTLSSIRRHSLEFPFCDHPQRPDLMEWSQFHLSSQLFLDLSLLLQRSKPPPVLTRVLTILANAPYYKPRDPFIQVLSTANAFIMSSHALLLLSPVNRC